MNPRYLMWKRWTVAALIGTGGLAVSLVHQVDQVPFATGEQAFADETAPQGEITGRAVPGVLSVGKKTLRPAAAGPSPEEILQRQLPPSARPEELREPTKSDMEQRCFLNPRCRQKLEQAKQGTRPTTILPAATGPSPEEQLQKQLLPPAQGVSPQRPRSQEGSGPVEQLLSWFNPFTPASAWAQTGYSLTLTPANRSSTVPTGYINIYGGWTMGTAPGFHILESSYPTPSPTTENQPFIYLSAYLPAAGYYVIDFVAAPSFTKLRHQNNGPILETWDYRTTGCGGANTCHYVTVDYYAAGPHSWCFWADPSAAPTFFYSVTIKSFL
jgi:hypothetical protein